MQKITPLLWFNDKAEEAMSAQELKSWTRPGFFRYCPPAEGV